MNLREALAHALGSIDLPSRVRDALLLHPVGEVATRVLAIGKASGGMVDGAISAWGDRLRGGLVVIPDGAPAPRDARFQVLRAAHPLPDERSAAAAEAALAFVADVAGGPALALISGGASSLVFLPVAHAHSAHALLEARATLSALLVSGASVGEINVVRRHASLAHGGALATPGMLTLLASDVIDGAPHDIGSGPTVPDPTTREKATRLLARFAPAHAHLPLRETAKPAPGDARFLLPPVFVVEPGALAAALARELAAIGLAARVLPPSTADVVTLAREVIALAATLPPGHALVRSAEPSVTIGPRLAGAGGRCTHLAALVARELPPGVTFLAAASDGVDGASGTGGAIVRRDSFADRVALDAAIASFDTGPLHVGAGTALPSRPTGLNLTDMHVLVREGVSP